MAKIKLSQIDTKAPKELKKEEVKLQTEAILKELDELQNLLYAAHTHAVLVVIQGMDASGKDGAIRDVFSSLNPQGVDVYSFKVPTKEEFDHDFLWRVHKQAPAKGMIQIFNRSHYEDVLQLDHPSDKIMKKRYEAINCFEQLLIDHNNTLILKFYLHVSHEEQQKRLQERVSNPEKMWKYNEEDFGKSEKFKQFQDLYEAAFEQCSEVPWTIVPTDNNWYKVHIIAKTLRDALKDLKMKYPVLKQTGEK
ncbi:PPK2 family polyphosphate:nucleotide phosphotransferase [Chitinophaga skermanii]|uniref:PPK2 family polyphosphate:nucleotide phosphotransferase n=1 Tax=Chitinophaga skermanii TaxID=331697 RepID=A0A327QJY2_9BACT|nr:PPK2 family polyphosphate kinase [Chitinophaga skermanii]RAJ03994.1 PPK2 family polyphosphate:nucleotide phosphotransferase [Chitinophaga skermanii]